jgi:hypothetical protein
MEDVCPFCGEEWGEAYGCEHSFAWFVDGELIVTLDGGTDFYQGEDTDTNSIYGYLEYSSVSEEGAYEEQVLLAEENLVLSIEQDFILNDFEKKIISLLRETRWQIRDVLLSKFVNENYTEVSEGETFSVDGMTISFTRGNLWAQNPLKLKTFFEFLKKINLHAKEWSAENSY